MRLERDGRDEACPPPLGWSLAQSYRAGVPRDSERVPSAVRGVLPLVEGFDRRWTEPFELFRSELGQNSGASAKKSKSSGMFNILENIGEIPTKFHENLSKHE